MRRRVVITGIGIYSCIGKNLDEVTSSLFQGKSGIGIDPARTTYGYRSPLTGILEPPAVKDMLSRRLRMSLPQEGEYAYLATLEAMQTASVDPDFLSSHEMGVIYGNDASAAAIINTHEIMQDKRDSLLIGAGGVFQSMTSTVSMNLSTIFKLRGINMTIGAACASGSHAVGMAYTLIRSGMQDLILCGGAQETNVYSMAGFDGLAAFSRQVDDPTRASRPFDADRDGLVPSGGAASLILEDLTHAKKRGATIYGEIIGYGFSSNGADISKASETGSLVAIERALADAGKQPADIDYINAHATSTPQGDRCEALALDQLFGAVKTPVSSTKSMTGHECWMAGASELVYSLLMMKNDFMAPNINFNTPDEAAERLNILPQTVERGITSFVSNSFGFGGTNSVLVVSKYK